MSQELAHSVVKSTKYVILDTDMGTDDVWALIMLLKAERSFSNIKLLAITCVHGNTSMANVITNTFAVLDIMERTDVRLHQNASCMKWVHFSQKISFFSDSSLYGGNRSTNSRRTY